MDTVQKSSPSFVRIIASFSYFVNLVICILFLHSMLKKTGVERTFCNLTPAMIHIFFCFYFPIIQLQAISIYRFFFFGFGDCYSISIFFSANRSLISCFSSDFFSSGYSSCNRIITGSKSTSFCYMVTFFINNFLQMYFRNHPVRCRAIRICNHPVLQHCCHQCG